VCATVSFFTHAGKPADVGVNAIAVYSAGAMVGGLVLPLFAPRWRTNVVLLASIAVATLCGVFVSGAFFMLYPPTARFWTADRDCAAGHTVRAVRADGGRDAAASARCSWLAGERCTPSRH
jgi:hypothetical protein